LAGLLAASFSAGEDKSKISSDAIAASLLFSSIIAVTGSSFGAGDLLAS